MKLNTIFAIAIAVIVLASHKVSANIHNSYIVEFDHNGKAVKNAGKCNVEQWAEVAHSITQGSAPGVGHRYIVEFEPCHQDKIIPKMSEGLCCDQRTSKVTYTFKKHCSVSALQKTCGEKMTSHNEMKIVLYRQCDRCKAEASGCSAFGYCNVANPYSNVMPSALVCDKMCQPHGSIRMCRPRHIFSELTNEIMAKMTVEEKTLIAADNDFQELKLRCAQECRPTKNNFACVVWSKAEVLQRRTITSTVTHQPSSSKTTTVRTTVKTSSHTVKK